MKQTSSPEDSAQKIFNLENQLNRAHAHLVWACNCIHVPEISNAFTAHVLRRGGTGDYSDCVTFIDQQIEKDQC